MHTAAAVATAAGREVGFRIDIKVKDYNYMCVCVYAGSKVIKPCMHVEGFRSGALRLQHALQTTDTTHVCYAARSRGVGPG